MFFNFIRFYFSCLLLFCFSCIGFNAHAQLKADFAISDADKNGCESPAHIVEFRNRSTGNATAWFWDFGNGATSNLQNPIGQSYTTPGTYTVSLTISDGTSSDTKTKESLVTIFPNPVAFFTFDNLDYCEGTSVQFNNESTVADNSTLTYVWDFGDGNTSTDVNPTHQFTSGGKREVTLMANNDNCTSLLAVPIDILFNPTPDSITASPKGACAAPLVTTITAHGLDPANHQYSWNFDGGQTNSSSESSPIVTYNALGYYDATLNITNNQGCTNTIDIKKIVGIETTTASFSVDGGLEFCAGDSIQFINRSTGRMVHNKWNFNNGQTDTSRNSQMAFNNNGPQEIQLISSNQVCNDTTTQVIEIVKMTASFFTKDTFSCRRPDTISVNSFFSSNVDNVKWYATTALGLVVDSTENRRGTFRLPFDGLYNILLVYQNTLGCSDTLFKEAYIEIKEPELSNNSDKIFGCIPLTATIRNNSSVGSDDSIKSTAWKFDDLDTTFYGLSVERIFRDSSRYTGTMTVETAAGCYGQVPISVYPGINIQPSFEVLTKEICTSDSLLVKNHDTLFALEKQDYAYSYQYGDGSISAGLNPPHIYRDTGFFPIILTINNRFCLTNDTLDSAVHVIGSVAFFEHEAACENKRIISFINKSKYSDSLFWDFGDGFTSSELDPIHTYEEFGIYEIKLYSYHFETGCIDSIFRKIEVSQPKLLITPIPEPVKCISDGTFHFDASSSSNVDFFFWELQDGKISTRDEFDYTYSATGKYNIRLLGTDRDGCQDTAFISVEVIGVKPDIDIGTEEGCAPHDAIFTNNTKEKEAVKEWIWQIENFEPYTGPVHPSVTLTNPQSYVITLQLEDTFGCVFNDTTSITIHPNPDPLLSYKRVACADALHTFRNTNQLANEFSIWSFGSNQSYGKKLDTMFNARGVLDFTLTATNDFGCTNSISDSIKVEQPIPNFSGTPRTGHCQAFATKFQLQDTTDIAKWEWFFGENSNSTPDAIYHTVNSPTNTYDIPGQYDVELRVVTHNNCEASILLENYISLTGIHANLEISRDSICIGEDVTFWVRDTIGTFNARLKPGDQSSERFIPVDSNGYSYTYELATSKNNFYQPSMVIESENCTRTISNDINILVDSVSISIDSLAQPGGCPPFSTAFTSTSSSNVTNWKWNLDNGTEIYTASTPEIIFDSIGSYVISVVGQGGVLGCFDSNSIEITVHPFPIIEPIDEVVVCANIPSQVSLNILAADNPTVLWRPDYFIDDIESSVVQLTPFSSITYTVAVTNEHGCKSEITVATNVVPELQAYTSYQDTTIKLGDNAPIIAFTSLDQISSLQWTPSATLSCENCLTPIATPLETTEYTLLATDTSGCFANEYKVLVQVEEDVKVELPSAFTPNGDGVNDELIINGWGIESINNFEVFNRWGRSIWSTTNLNEGWNGQSRNGKQQNMDTYVYKISVNYLDGTSEEVIGEVALIR